MNGWELQLAGEREKREREQTINKYALRFYFNQIGIRVCSGSGSGSCHGLPTQLDICKQLSRNSF